MAEHQPPSAAEAAPAPVTAVATGASGTSQTQFRSNNPFAQRLAQQHSGASSQTASTQATGLKNAPASSASDPFEVAELQAALTSSSGQSSAQPQDGQDDAAVAGKEIKRPDSPDSEPEATAARDTETSSGPSAAAASPFAEPPASTSAPTRAYAPPPHAPPPLEHSSSHRSSSSDIRPPPQRNASTSSRTSQRHAHLPPGFEPTTVPTGGHPLLLTSQPGSSARPLVLLYKHPSEPCSKCRGTGYKRADPLHPCRRCWDKYGVPWDAVRGGEVDMRNKSLQAPLPNLSHHPPPPGPPGMSPPLHSPASMHGPGWGPPAVQPAPSPMPPRQPPRVQRAADADEALLDPNGEAPPPYEAVVTSNEPLPPQRPLTESQAAQHSGSPPTAFSPPSHPPEHHHQHHAPPGGHYSGGGGYPGAMHPQHHAPPAGYDYGQGAAFGHAGPGPAPWQPPPQQPYFHLPNGGWGHGPGHAGGYGAHPIPAHRPPPGALVVAPGDPRIGGTLCWKCGGAGVRESFWSGTETCYVCGGAGRIL